MEMVKSLNKEDVKL